MKYLGSSKGPSQKKIPEKAHDFAADNRLELKASDKICLGNIFIYELYVTTVKFFFQVFLTQHFFDSCKLL